MTLAPGLRLYARHHVGTISQVWAFVLLSLLSSSCMGQESAAQESAAYKITGIVQSERDGAPVSRCHLTATRSRQTSAPRLGRMRRPATATDPSTDTDGSGHFSLTLPSAGTWHLYASGRGFRQQAYDRHENFFSSVVLTPETPTYDLVFRLEPDSAITGWVRDEAGEAVRNARITLYTAIPTDTGAPSGPASARGNAMTDDRGHYELAGLPPGDYTVGLQAQPWYAATLAGFRPTLASGPPSDPSLDVVYHQTWFPGVTSRRSAEVLHLQHGESRQADFNLVPVPAIHVRFTPSPPTEEGSGGGGEIMPQIDPVSLEGMPFAGNHVQIDRGGEIDVGGLSPGLYRVTLHEGGTAQTARFLTLAGGAQRTLDLSAAIPAAELTLHLGPEGAAERLQIVFTDIETGATFLSDGGDGFARRPHGDHPPVPAETDRKLQLPPGTYRVTLNGSNEIYLAGISVKQSALPGRIVTVASGSTILDLKLVRGRASVHGIASLAGKALPGAMVLLVPASYGQPESITILRRDQTNTDGGFLLDDVIPGNYILLAISNGWSINWRDPSTLDRYLVHGVPLSLAPGADLKQNLQALAP